MRPAVSSSQATAYRGQGRVAPSTAINSSTASASVVAPARGERVMAATNAKHRTAAKVSVDRSIDAPNVGDETPVNGVALELHNDVDRVFEIVDDVLASKA